MAIHVSTPGSSRIIRYDIQKLGNLKTFTLNPSLNVDKESYQAAYDQKQIIEVDFRPADYQSQLAAIVVSKSVLNINYINPLKNTGKVNRFEVQSKTIVNF